MTLMKNERCNAVINNKPSKYPLVFICQLGQFQTCFGASCGEKKEIPKPDMFTMFTWS